MTPAREAPAPTTRPRPVHRALLAARVLGVAARVAFERPRRPLATLVARLDHPGRVRRPVEPRRLGRLVYRVLNLGPLRARCLTTSLVLFRELRRQGTPAQLVIGLPPDPSRPDAHAWVEVEGREVGPPPGRLGHRELARYGEEPPSSASTSAREASSER